MSSCEVEYIAAAIATCQAIWLAKLMSEILSREIGRPVLNIDNKSAILLIKNSLLNEWRNLNEWRMHIDTRFHLIREYEANGLISVSFIRTEDQMGDILTKALNRVKFRELCSKIGLYTSAG
jgi:hypothetical protein